jgi:hypothetical protein
MLWDAHNVALLSSKLQCTEHLQVCLCVHTFFDVRIWKYFMTGTAPFLYLCLLATHRCRLGAILVEITSWNPPAPILTFTSSYVSPSTVLYHARLLVVPDLYKYFVK